MVGLQLSSGTVHRPPSFLSGGSTPLGAGPALEQLKKTVRLQGTAYHLLDVPSDSPPRNVWTVLQADRLVEEQQSNKNATEAYVSTALHVTVAACCRASTVTVRSNNV